MTSDLRERKKHETRQELMHAALICSPSTGSTTSRSSRSPRAANVSTRTFFRYFDTKAAACFGLTQRLALEDVRASADVLTTTEEQIRDYATRVVADPQLLRDAGAADARATRRSASAARDPARSSTTRSRKGSCGRHPGLDPVTARLAALPRRRT